MNKSALIRKLLLDHPAASVPEIAAMVPCMPEYVRVVRSRKGGVRPCDVQWAKKNPEAVRQRAREYHRRKIKTLRVLAHAEDLASLAAAGTLTEPCRCALCVDAAPPRRATAHRLPMA